MRNLLIAAAAVLLLAGPVVAQQNCAPRELVVEKLANDYGESRSSLGLAKNNRVMEVFRSQETGSWTITVTHPNGITCLVASGQSFEEVNETLPEDNGDPT